MSEVFPGRGGDGCEMLNFRYDRRKTLCSFRTIWTIRYEYSSGSKPFFEVGFFIIMSSSESESLRLALHVLEFMDSVTFSLP